jgi:hypothetical protein
LRSRIRGTVHDKLQRVGLKDGTIAPSGAGILKVGTGCIVGDESRALDLKGRKEGWMFILKNLGTFRFVRITLGEQYKNRMRGYEMNVPMARELRWRDNLQMHPIASPYQNTQDSNQTEDKGSLLKTKGPELQVQ